MSADLVRLIELAESFPRQRILVLADLVADEFVTGQITRVSREAPVLILRHSDTRLDHAFQNALPRRLFPHLEPAGAPRGPRAAVSVPARGPRASGAPRPPARRQSRCRARE